MVNIDDVAPDGLQNARESEQTDIDHILSTLPKSIYVYSLTLLTRILRRLTSQVPNLSALGH